MDVRNAQSLADGRIDMEIRHPGLGWIPFTASEDSTDPDVRKAWQAAQTLTIAPAPPAYPTREDALSALLQWQEEALAPYTAGVTQQELMSWPTKSAAAAAYTSGTATDDQRDMIEAEAETAGVTPASVAEKITALSREYTLLVAAMSGIRQAARDAIMSGTQPAQWAAAIDAARAKFSARTDAG